MDRPFREDWDYVSFENYEKDTRDLTERAAVVIKDLRRQIKARESVIWALVKAAGGRISVRYGDMHEPPKNWVIHDDPASDSRIFSIGKS